MSALRFHAYAVLDCQGCGEQFTSDHLDFVNVGDLKDRLKDNIGCDEHHCANCLYKLENSERLPGIPREYIGPMGTDEDGIERRNGPTCSTSAPKATRRSTISRARYPPRSFPPQPNSINNFTYGPYRPKIN